MVILASTVGRNVSSYSCKYYFETDKLPNPRRTQPPKKKVKSGMWATFFPHQIIFRGLGLVLYRKQTTRTLTQPDSRKQTTRTQTQPDSRETGEIGVITQALQRAGETLVRPHGLFALSHLDVHVEGSLLAPEMLARKLQRPR